MHAGLEKEAQPQEPPYRKPSHLSLLDAAGQAAFTPQGDSEDKPDDAASWAVSHSARVSWWPCSAAQHLQTRTRSMHISDSAGHAVSESYNHAAATSPASLSVTQAAVLQSSC